MLKHTITPVALGRNPTIHACLMQTARIHWIHQMQACWSVMCRGETQQNHHRTHRIVHIVLGRNPTPYMRRPNSCNVYDHACTELCCVSVCNSMFCVYKTNTIMHVLSSVWISFYSFSCFCSFTGCSIRVRAFNQTSGYPWIFLYVWIAPINLPLGLIFRFPSRVLGLEPTT